MKKEIIAIGILATTVLVVAFVLFICGDKTEESNKESYEIVDISSIDNGIARYKVANLVNTMCNGNFEIDNEKYIVISNGVGLTYKVDEENNRILYRDDMNSAISSVVLKVDRSMDIVKCEEIRGKDGILKLVIVGAGENRMEYLPEVGEISKSIKKYNRGLYKAVYKDGILMDLKPVEHMIINGCTVVEFLPSKNYIMDIGNGVDIMVELDKLNLSEGYMCSVDLEWDASMEQFKGKVL